MFRTTLAFLFVLTAPAAAQVTGSLGPEAPMLKRNVTVSSDVVRIGDLIDNAGRAGEIAIFRAPDLGTTGAVSGRLWLSPESTGNQHHRGNGNPKPRAKERELLATIPSSFWRKEQQEDCHEAFVDYRSRGGACHAGPG